MGGPIINLNASLNRQAIVIYQIKILLSHAFKKYIILVGGRCSQVFSSVRSHSRVRLFVTPRTSLSITNSRSLLKLMSIESVMPSNHLVLSCPLLLPSMFPSIRVFANESVLCIRWAKYWRLSISSSNEYSGLISLRIDSFDLLAVQGTLKSTTIPKHQFFGTRPFTVPCKKRPGRWPAFTFCHNEDER